MLPDHRVIAVHPLLSVFLAQTTSVSPSSSFHSSLSSLLLLSLPFAVAVTVRSSSAHSCVKIFPTARKEGRALNYCARRRRLSFSCAKFVRGENGALFDFSATFDGNSSSFFYGFCLITSRKNGLTVLPSFSAGATAGVDIAYSRLGRFSQRSQSFTL